MKRLFAAFTAVLLFLIFYTTAVSASEYDRIIKTKTIISKNGLYKCQIICAERDYPTEDIDRPYKSEKVKFLRIKKYLGKDNLPETYTIPKRIDGYEVEKVCRGAFVNLSSIKILRTADNSWINLEKRAFYNCNNLSAFIIGMNTGFDDEAVGFIHGKVRKGFKLIFGEDDAAQYRTISGYIAMAKSNGFNPVFDISKAKTKKHKELTNSTINIMNCGGEFSCTVDGHTVNGWRSNKPNIMSVTDDGKAVFRSKGRAAISVTVGTLKIRRIFNIESDPEFYTGTRFDLKSLKIKQNRMRTVKIYGKASSINNVYKSTSTAKIISKPNAEKIRIKGLKKGNTVLKIRVNGKWLRLKVKVL